MAAARSRGGVDDTGVKPRSDAYVGLLGLSLLALTASMLFAYLNWSTISEKPPQVKMAPPAGGGKTAPPTPQGGAGMPPVPGGAAGQAVPGQAAPGNPPPPPNNPPPQPK